MCVRLRRAIVESIPRIFRDNSTTAPRETSIRNRRSAADFAPYPPP
jgi:hypothetical protein